MSKFTNFFNHLHTINHHRHLVIKHCAKAGILFQGLGHDLSKYSFIEFFSGVKYYTNGNKSPNELERDLYGYSVAWLHHKGRNKHHFEYWTDFDKVSNTYKPVKMPLKYVKEMFCDRVAACKTYRKKNYKDSDSLDYYVTKQTSKLLYPDTANLLEKWLRLLAECGEEKVFEEIRNTKSY